MHRVDQEAVVSAIRDGLRVSGLSAAEASRRATGQEDALKRIFAGRSPNLNRLHAVADTLGLEFYVGPPRAVVESGIDAPESQTERPSQEAPLPWDENPGAFFPGEPDSFVPMEVRHTVLAMVLTAIYRHFEALNEYEREHFVLDLLERSGLGVKMQLHGLEEVVIWLCTARRDTRQVKRILGDGEFVPAR